MVNGVRHRFFDQTFSHNLIVFVFLERSNGAVEKYVSILDRKTWVVLLISIAVTYVCLKQNYRSDVNLTLFSLAVIFPLVFTIREAFKRRDNAIALLSLFKSSLSATYFCCASNRKLDDERTQYVGGELELLSNLFFETLYSDKSKFDTVRKKLDEISFFISEHDEYFSSSTAIKLFRFLKDARESMENVFGLSTHGTPVSLRAYCLVFIYAFPLIFVPSLVAQISNYSDLAIFMVSATPGFILVTLYNIQERMEDPFDQSGLDDIKIEEFSFKLPNNPYKNKFLPHKKPKLKVLSTG